MAIASAFVADPSIAQPSPPPNDTSDRLARAIEHYQRSEFDQAKLLLQSLLRGAKSQQTRVVQQAHTYLGFVEVAFNRIDSAVSSFERALSINRNLELGPTSPKIREAFEQARRRYQTRMKALDHDAPAILHEASREATYGAPFTVRAAVNDANAVSRVELRYRVSGSRGYASVNLERTETGQYIASIPPSMVVQPGIEYYLVAWDELGNGPATKGTATTPIRIAVKGGPKRTVLPQPWYKKWWIWALTAGTVAAAGGVAAGVFLTRSEIVSGQALIPQGLDPSSSTP